MRLPRPKLMSGRGNARPRATGSLISAYAVDAVPRSFWLVDSPTATQSWDRADVLHIKGWVASPVPVDKIWFVDPAIEGTKVLRRTERPDVAEIYGLYTSGFEAELPVALLGSRETVEIAYLSDDETTTIVVPAQDRSVPEADARAAKRRRLVNVLRCPTCRGRLTHHVGSFACQHCLSRYAETDSSLDFLPDELRSAFMIAPTDNVSSNSYDGTAINIINRLHDGLILDCGAGSQAVYYPNVVNLEIVDYPSTDVLSVGERLPFADGSFDGVFSFAVLEHVKNPFDCAAEIVRVLKPGGVLYCQVPFLQPVHAYPNHFYNMTSQGLRTLFSSLEVTHDGTFPFGQPIFSLTWILGVYASSLPAETAARFKAMTVEELMAPANSFLAADFVNDLSTETKDVLSACNYVVARKPAHDGGGTTS